MLATEFHSEKRKVGCVLAVGELTECSISNENWRKYRYRYYTVGRTA